MTGSTVEQNAISRLREFTEALRSGQPIGDKFPIRRVVLSLVAEPFSPKMVRETRDLLWVSQALFASFMGVKKGTVQKWETGEITPSLTACRLMEEIKQNPEYWRARLADSLSVSV